LTRGYVLLAIGLIVLVAISTSTIAFVLYAATLKESVASATDRAVQRSAYYESQHEPLQQYAVALVHDVARPRLAVAVYQHDKLVAGRNERPSPGAVAISEMLGLHPTVTRVPGGVVFVGPDLDGIVRVLSVYWLSILPVGVVAVIIAWALGRRITRHAVAPLGDVTRALHRIAEGDFTPAPVADSYGELRGLTDAYNEVAYRLSAATEERRRNELQMRQFIADAGHELRTPLTVIMGYLDALSQGVVRDPEGVARVQATMLEESRRMRKVIEKLIYLARLEREPDSAALQRVDASATAQRAVSALEPLANGRIRFTSGGAGGAFVQADENELYDALKNVVENAIRYAPDSPVDVEIRREDGSVRVTVADAGPGMNSTDRDRAFDRFYRGEARGTAEGSGLGLSIAKRAVERFGGTIDLDSAPGRGTRVTMTLPAA
jgi:two-component system OmpR family sensor kinase